MRSRNTASIVLASLIAASSLACDATTPDPASPAQDASAPAPSTARWATTTFTYPFEATLPEGWEVTDDSSSIVSMAPTVDAGLYVEFMSDRLVMARDCDLAPEAGVGTTAADIVAAVTGSDDLEVTGPTPVTVGSWSGLQVDFALPDDGSGSCTLEGGAQAVPLIGIQDASGWLYNAASPAEAYRYVVLDAPGGGTVLISMSAMDPASLADLLDAAMPMVEGLTFDSGS